MINAHVPNATVAHRARTIIIRPGEALFWMQFGLILAVVGIVIATLVGMLPSAQPLARMNNVQRIRDIVLAGDTARDPLMQLAPGITVRSSNLRGMKLDGDTYYYYFEGSDSYDPLSRGSVSPKDIDVVLRDDNGTDVLVIYRLQ